MSMTEREKRQCQNCKKEFTVESDDFAFYEKIRVPPPTFCPDCRMQRRFIWRNERTLYKGKCAATGKEFLTMFSPESNMVVYDRDYWWSDKWDNLASGREYDFSKPFFEQYRDLLHRAPLPNLANTNVTRSDYGNHNADCKDCYLLYASYMNENVSFSSGIMEGKDSMDLYNVLKCELCYDDTLCDNINRVFFSFDAGESMDSAFLRHCTNVNESLGCVNLRNKRYHIFNKPYSKDEYQKERVKYDFGSYKNLQAFKKEFDEFDRKFPREFASLIRSVDTTGDQVGDAKNCKFCFDGYGETEDSKYAIHAQGLKDSYDGYGFGGIGELLYEGVDSGINAARYKFTVYAHGNHDVEYAYCCHFSSHLFGCVGLRNREYCILNKQYSKEEYEALVPKIVEHMNAMPYVDAAGRKYAYGEFFPCEISPFAYNETIAEEYFPLKKEEAAVQKYPWKELGKKEHTVTVEAENLPDHVKDVADDILKEVIGCAHKGECTDQCTGAFKIIADELDFYRKFNLALPRLCPNCRNANRLKLRNPFKLWHRKCQCGGAKSENGTYTNLSKHAHGEGHCPNEFETSFSPEKPDIIYCAECYQQEKV